MEIRRIFKNRYIRVICFCLIGILIIIIGCDIIVSHNAKGRTYDNTADIPHRKMGLLLGTSPYWGNHNRNRYFECRIQAAAELYAAGKIDSIIVSGGDYRHKNGYDEPVSMRDSLMAHGVPQEKILMDYDGVRTINSIANIPDKYHTDTITIISQKYHNERALYQADHLNIDAIAYNAKTPSKITKLIKNRGREYFARLKLFIDLWKEGSH